MPEAPLCTVVAGPNGAGKSSVFEHLSPPGEFVNADSVARRLRPEAPERASMAAGRAVLHRLDALIAARHSFSYETTLSSNQALRTIARARAAEYRVELAFVVLRAPELNVARVRQRVALGGHDIPVPTILRRHAGAFVHLPEAIRLSNQVVVFDNTEPELHILVRIRDGVLEFTALSAAVPLHLRIGAALRAALNLPAESVFVTLEN